MTKPPAQPPVSPWVFVAADYQQNALTITVTFNNTTGALTGATVVRDPGCVYSKIYLGLGADGTPDTTPMVFSVPSGTVNVTAGQLGSKGLHTISDVLAVQVTAGP